MASFKWEVSPEQAFTQLYDDYTRSIYREIQRLASHFAPQIEAWMKRNAPWTDRTGNLRQSLYADVETALTEIVILFDYGLDYGVYLEFKNQGQYAVISPALDYWGPRFWDAVQALFR